MCRWPEALAERSAPRDGDAVDLDVEGPRPLRHAEEDPRRRVFREITLIDFVEGFEALGRDAEHVALEHMVEARAGRLERRLHLLEDKLGLSLERRICRDLAGLRIERRHARYEHHLACARASRHRRAPFLEIAVERFDANDLSFHGSLPVGRVI